MAESDVIHGASLIFGGKEILLADSTPAEIAEILIRMIRAYVKTHSTGGT